jgi:hypothetical protein
MLLSTVRGFWNDRYARGDGRDIAGADADSLNRLGGRDVLPGEYHG